MNIDFNNFIKTSYNFEYNIINNLHYPKNLYVQNHGKEIMTPLTNCQSRLTQENPYIQFKYIPRFMIKNYYFMYTVYIYLLTL